MALRYRPEELASMPENERAEALSALVAATKNGSVEAANAMLEARIRQYEIRYEMSSAELTRKLASGDLRETAEIARWLFLIGARDCRISG